MVLVLQERLAHDAPVDGQVSCRLRVAQQTQRLVEVTDGRVELRQVVQRLKISP